MESAKRILDSTEAVNFRDMDAAAHAVGSLRGMVRTLLAIAEEQPKSARMRLQHDAEFKNLARAFRMEAHGIQGGFSRMVRIADAMFAMAEPDENGGQG